MAFNHKIADFWFPNFGFKRSLLSLLKATSSHLMMFMQNLNTITGMASLGASECQISLS